MATSSGRRALLALLALAAGLAGGALAQARPVVLATTTSTQDTGLLDAILPPFERREGLKVKVIAVGTGQALATARRGDADLVLVHSPADEERFVREGHGIERQPVFYNDFVVVGPAADPARVRNAKGPAAALQAIADSEALFVSRGDDSGTHRKEQSLWKAAGRPPAGSWYLAAGAGQAEALRMASERGAYALTDRGSFLALRATLRLAVLHEGGAELRNPYAVIVVNPAKHRGVNAGGARALAAYLQEPGTRRVIGRFGVDRYGEPLFRLFPPARR